MPNDTTFESFEKELNRLVDSFGKRLAELKSTDYNEAKLRDDFLNPFFRALSWFFLQKSNIAQRDDFPKIVLKETRSLPFPKIDLKNRADKSRHDKLVSLVDKMLGLMPKLRAATLESEKAVLQNAVTATDHQIDQLVYELYNLTPEEIALVEATA